MKRLLLLLILVYCVNCNSNSNNYRKHYSGDNSNNNYHKHDSSDTDNNYRHKHSGNHKGSSSSDSGFDLELTWTETSESEEPRDSSEETDFTADIFNEKQLAASGNNFLLFYVFCTHNVGSI